MTRIIVAGGCDYADYDKMKENLDALTTGLEDVEIVSGGAKGADSLGERYAAEKGIPCKVFPAEWKKYGRAAGIIRNAQMIEYAQEEDPLVVVFWDGKSHGTGNTIGRAQEKGIRTVVVRY